MAKKSGLETVGTVAGLGLLAVFWAFAAPVFAAVIAVLGLPFIVIAAIFNHEKTGKW